MAKLGSPEIVRDPPNSGLEVFCFQARSGLTLGLSCSSQLRWTFGGRWRASEWAVELGGG